MSDEQPMLIRVTTGFNHTSDCQKATIDLRYYDITMVAPKYRTPKKALVCRETYLPNRKMRCAPYYAFKGAVIELPEGLKDVDSVEELKLMYDMLTLGNNNKNQKTSL